MISKQASAKASLAVFFLAAIFFCSRTEAKMSEGELKEYCSAFLSRTINDNPEQEKRIRECLGSMIKRGGSGIRLLDRFGLFYYDCKKHGVRLNRVRFYSSGGVFAFFIVMDETKDAQIYNLFVEFEMDGSRGGCSLKEIYFSMVFEEKMKGIREFFESK